jgi:hypothetical protein
MPQRSERARLYPEHGALRSPSVWIISGGTKRVGTGVPTDDH